jgi:hypothetical protein
MNSISSKEIIIMDFVLCPRVCDTLIVGAETDDHPLFEKSPNVFTLSHQPQTSTNHIELNLGDSIQLNVFASSNQDRFKQIVIDNHVLSIVETIGTPVVATLLSMLPHQGELCLNPDQTRLVHLGILNTRNEINVPHVFLHYLCIEDIDRYFQDRQVSTYFEFYPRSGMSCLLDKCKRNGTLFQLKIPCYVYMSRAGQFVYREKEQNVHMCIDDQRLSYEEIITLTHATDIVFTFLNQVFIRNYLQDVFHVKVDFIDRLPTMDGTETDWLPSTFFKCISF